MFTNPFAKTVHSRTIVPYTVLCRNLHSSDPDTERTSEDYGVITWPIRATDCCSKARRSLTY